MQNTIRSNWLTRLWETDSATPAARVPTAAFSSIRQEAQSGADVTLADGRVGEILPVRRPAPASPLEMAMNLVELAAPMPVAQVRIYLIY